MISYEQFLSVIKDDLGFYINFDTDPRDRRKKRGETVPAAVIGETWVTGGSAGGSCWDDGNSSHYAVTPDREPDLENLQKVLEHLTPQLSFLAFNRLQKELVTVAEGFGYSEYYGNYTTMSAKYVVLADLYNFLAKEGLLPNEPPIKPKDKEEDD